MSKQPYPFQASVKDHPDHYTPLYMFSAESNPNLIAEAIYQELLNKQTSSILIDRLCFALGVDLVRGHLIAELVNLDNPALFKEIAAMDFIKHAVEEGKDYSSLNDFSTSLFFNHYFWMEFLSRSDIKAEVHSLEKFTKRFNLNFENFISSGVFRTEKSVSFPFKLSLKNVLKQSVQTYPEITKFLKNHYKVIEELQKNLEFTHSESVNIANNQSISFF